MLSTARLSTASFGRLASFARPTLLSVPRVRLFSAAPADSVVGYEVQENGVALITLQNPPVNSLSRKVLDSLTSAFQRAQADAAVKAIVLRGSNGTFMAGADLAEIQRLQQRPREELVDFIDSGTHLFNNLIEGSVKPVVAAIDGNALGGGLELALACHSRVVTPASKLGLPEIALGIFPGLGGTQRLPRLVGLQRALESILQLKNFSAADARKFGLVDVVSTSSTLLADAEAVALRMARGDQRPTRVLRDLAIRDTADEAKAIFDFASKGVSKAPVNSPHLQACLDSIKAAKTSADPLDGLRVERDRFLDVAQGIGARSLVHYFFAEKAIYKVAGLTDKGLEPRPITNVAVVGGGLMGSGIATACLLKGLNVTLKEMNKDALAAGVGRIHKNIASRVTKGRMTEAQRDETLSRLHPQEDYAGFDRAQLVIEAIVEDLKVKQDLFRNLESVCAPDAILATNTSTINVEHVARDVIRKERVAGAHFFSPAHVMPLLEIVRPATASDQTVLDLLQFSKTLGKKPVVVGNCEGFAVNRTFFPYGQSADLLVDRGVDPYRIDRAIVNFGMPMGPFRLTDLVGNDVYLFVNGIFEQAYRERTYQTPLRQILLQAGRKGEKSGSCYYKFDANRQPSQDPELQKYVAESIKRASLPSISIKNDQEIIERVFFPVVNEGCRVLGENIVSKASDLDVASVFGMNFPQTRGGLMYWADTVGASYIYEKLNQWYEEDGVFYKPSDYLTERAKTGKLLSDM